PRAIHRVIGNVLVESAAAAAMRCARHVVAAHIGRYRNVDVARRAGPLHRQTQSKDFRPAGVLEDLRAGSSEIASIQEAEGRIATNGIGKVGPPLRALAAQLIELGYSIELGPARGRGDTTAGDNGPRAFVDDSVRFVLVESLMYVLARVV